MHDTAAAGIPAAAVVAILMPLGQRK